MHPQVTAASVRLIDSSGAKLLAEWALPEGRSINLAASSPSQVLLSTGGGALTLLAIQEGGLVVAGSTNLQAEVACLDITPIGERHFGGGAGVEVCLLHAAGRVPAAGSSGVTWAGRFHTHSQSSTVPKLAQPDTPVPSLAPLPQAAHSSPRTWRRWAAGRWRWRCCGCPTCRPSPACRWGRSRSSPAACCSPDLRAARTTTCWSASATARCTAGAWSMTVAASAVGGAPPRAPAPLWQPCAMRLASPADVSYC